MGGFEILSFLPGSSSKNIEEAANEPEIAIIQGSWNDLAVIMGSFPHYALDLEMGGDPLQGALIAMIGLMVASRVLLMLKALTS